jgi:nickel-type superoxide dismutase maturation protease
MLTFLRVEGRSMEPAFREGDFLLVKKWGEPQPGEAVVVRHPDTGRRMVKRLARREGLRLYVLGDSPEHSTDSRQFGALDPSLLVGRVWKKF